MQMAERKVGKVGKVGKIGRFGRFGKVGLSGAAGAVSFAGRHRRWRPPGPAARLVLCGLMTLTAWRRAGAEMAPAPPTLPPVVNLDEALRLFHAHGLDLILAEATVESAEGDLQTAGAIPNPVLGLSGNHTFSYNPGSAADCGSGATCSANGFGIDLGDQAALFDSLSGKRGLRLRVARAALAAARQGRLDAVRTLEFQVKQQYIQTTLAQDQLDFAREVERAATKTFELNQIRYQKGAISEADEAKVEAAKLESDQAVSNARQGLQTAKLGLAFLLGARGKLPTFEVEPDLPKYAVPAPLIAASSASLLRLALEHRPDLEGQRKQVERAEGSIALARRQRVPDIALDVNYQQIGYGGIGTNAPLTPPTLTVGVSAPLPVFYHMQGEIRKAEADFKSADVERAKIEAQITNDVGSAFSTFATSRELVERMESRLLERAKRARDLVEIQYLRGAASLLEFLDAQRTYIGTNLEYLNDLSSYWIAVFQLEQAVGMDLSK
jgi:cobalt-zinc-cadmium efflux system outer membrane protein